MIASGETVLNFCANNYLGLSSHPEVVQAAKDALDTHGSELSVRFILWNARYSQNIRKKNLNSTNRRYNFICSRFERGVFEPFGRKTSSIKDSLNHAPIIDGVRRKASRYRYENKAETLLAVDRSQ
jgi:glycine C-acetyltransferase